MGEAIVDANAVRILEQEIRDAETAISGSAKQSLTRMKSAEIKLKREIATLDADVADYEQKAVAALNAGEEALATEVAERIAELEADRTGKGRRASHARHRGAQDSHHDQGPRARHPEEQARARQSAHGTRAANAPPRSVSKNFAATGSSSHRVSKA